MTRSTCLGVRFCSHFLLLFSHSTCLFFKSLEHVGRSNTNLSLVYVFNFATNAWSKVDAPGDAPSARKYHSTVLYDNAVYILGGCLLLPDRPLTNEFFRFDLSTERSSIRVISPINAFFVQKPIDGARFKRLEAFPQSRRNVAMPSSMVSALSIYM